MTKTEEKKSEWKSYNINIPALALVATLLAGLLAPCAYLLGLCFYQGSLAGYGVNPDLFPITTIEAYVSFYNIVTHILTLLFIRLPSVSEYLIFAAIGAVIYFFIYIFLYLIKKTKLFSNKKSKSIEKKDFIIPPIIDQIFLFFYSYLPLLSLAILVFWLIIPYSFYKKGESLSTATLITYQEKGCHIVKNKHWSNCVTLTIDEKKVIKGILVTTGKDCIAIYSEGNIHIIDTKKDFQITRQY